MVCNNARKRKKAPLKKDFGDAKERGDVSHPVNQGNVNSIYSKIYEHMKTELETANKLGKAAKFLFGDSHYSTSKKGAVTSEAGMTVGVNNDNVLVGLCALDIAKKLGIADFVLETDPKEIKFYENPQKRRSLIDPISLKHYAEHAAELKIKFRAGDIEAQNIQTATLNSITKEEHIKLEDWGKEGKHQEIRKFIKEKMDRIISEEAALREPAMIKACSTEGNSFAIFGAHHIPNIREALKNNYHVSILIGDSLIRDNDDKPTPEGIKIDKMIKTKTRMPFPWLKQPPKHIPKVLRKQKTAPPLSRPSQGNR